MKLTIGMRPTRTCERLRRAFALRRAAACAEHAAAPSAAEGHSRRLRRPRRDAAQERAEDLRLAQVLVDQIRLAPRFESYLPFSDDPLLGPILAALQADPGDRRSAAQWAREAGTTERTLSRRCHDQLGVSFNAWRQRLKVVAALALLDEGEPVYRIAERLGYGAPSGFIAMFRRVTGASPMQDRKV